MLTTGRSPQRAPNLAYFVLAAHARIRDVVARGPARAIAIHANSNAGLRARATGGTSVEPAPDLTAALALVDAKTTSDRGMVQAIVAAPSRRAEGERALPRARGCGKLAAPIDDSRTRSNR